MKKILLLFLLPCFLFAQDAKKVLIIGIDGCRPDGIAAANTPNLDQLIANGIYSPDALNDDITISGPGWSAILCGVWSEKHLVTNNDFNGNDYANYPTFFKYINDFDAALHTVSICHWNPINDFIIQDHADFKLNVATDQEVGAQAAAYISVNDPDVIFLHYDDVDHAGHSSGFTPNNPAYLTAIESVDSHIGPVLQAIAQRPNYANEDWLILVSTDHGGQGTSHGGTSIEEENVFVIASGKNIATSQILRDSMVISDAPINCLGDTTELRFAGADDFVQIPTDPVFDFGSDQDFTIECRVRTPTSADVAMVGNKDWDSGLNTGFVFSFKFPSGPEWKVNIGDGTNRADINTGGQIADNEWHTLSVSFDRDGLMKMYQDGAIVDSTDISFIGDITTGQGLFFGADINSAFDYAGSIAEVRVWDTVLDAQEIADWYCTGIGISHPSIGNLQGYWQLNDPAAGQQAMDISGNGHHGTINGAEWNSPDSMVIYDYSNTPRLVDLVPSALTHLCIPIDETWSLDGGSLIAACSPNTTNAPGLQLMQMRVSPNPASGQLQIELFNISFDAPVRMSLFQSDGSKVYEQTVDRSSIRLDLSTYPAGVYMLALDIDNQRMVEKVVKFSGR